MTQLTRIVAMSGTDDRGPYGLQYPWRRTDGGRSASMRPAQRNDCTVRALATAMGIQYDLAYDTIKAAGRKCSRGFRLGDWLIAQPSVRKISFPARKGERRMNIAAFVTTYPQGRFICKVSHHVFAVINGVVWDETENAPDRCIYTAWEITE